jgi:hypothetical protein
MKALAKSVMVLIALGFCLPSFGEILVYKCTSTGTGIEQNGEWKVQSETHRSYIILEVNYNDFTVTQAERIDYWKDKEGKWFEQNPMDLELVRVEYGSKVQWGILLKEIDIVEEEVTGNFLITAGSARSRNIGTGENREVANTLSGYVLSDTTEDENREFGMSKLSLTLYPSWTYWANGEDEDECDQDFDCTRLKIKEILDEKRYIERALLPDFSPATFSDSLDIDNPYFPLEPDTTFRYMAEEDGEVEINEVYVTSNTKTILGIDCRVVEDRVWVDSVLMEYTLDWYAQDDEGNVWYMGEWSTEYEYPDEGDPIENHEGSWEAGVDGAEPGILMLADPCPADSYRQEYYEGEAEDMARVLKLNASASVPYGDYEDCLETKEWTPLEPGVAEHKYYAPGVGLVLVEEPKGKGETVRYELTDVL